jgi:hypothetical protein
LVVAALELLERELALEQGLELGVQAAYLELEYHLVAVAVE